MREFTSAVEDVAAEDEREAKVQALIDEGKSREDAEREVEGDTYVEFVLDGRTIRAYQPNDGQLAFMLAALGRGQSQEGRFAAIVNIMLASLRGSDRDYLEGRMLASDRKTKLPIKKIEEIFEYLTEEWFARPTQPSSDSAPSLQSDGQN